MPKIYRIEGAMVLLLLTGCGQVANEVAAAGNEAGTPANSVSAEANATANMQGNLVWVVEPVALIPDEFHGIYDRDAAACASSGSEERLEVTESILRFHESIGAARYVRAENDQVISVEADFQGEGESWRNRLRLSLGAGGTLVVTQPDESSLTRIPCPLGL